MTADGSGLTGGTNPDAVVTVASTADPADPLSLFGSFTFGDAYQKARFVDADASECSDASRSCFNELGAVDGSTPLGALPQLLFQVYLQADATGTVTFAGEPADELPLHQVGRFGIDEGIPFTDIDYGATTLTITGAAPAASGPAASGPTTASADRHDVNGDGVVSPIDALIVINDLNRYGARSLLASSPLAFDGGSDMRAMDVNDDGYLSSIDALMVINFLDREPVSADAPPATIHRDPVEAPLAAEAPVATIESTSATEAEQPLVGAAIGAAIGGVERASDEAGPAAERDELPPTRATSPTAPTAAVDPRQGATQTARQGLPTARQTALDLEPILDEIAGDITRSGGW